MLIGTDLAAPNQSYQRPGIEESENRATQCPASEKPYWSYWGLAAVNFRQTD